MNIADGLREWESAFPLLWFVAVAILGGIVGSFLNVVIYRLPVMLERRWQREAQTLLAQPVSGDEQTFNLMFPRSHCPHCSHPLRLRDNIPLLSYLGLRGKSACCGATIPGRYLLVELTCALLFVLAARQFSADLLLPGAWTLMAMLLVLAVIDFRTQLLPDILTLSLLWLGLLFSWYGGFVPLDQAVIGALAGYLSLWSLFWLFRLATGKEALGYGDFKLFAALGAWMGWQALPDILLIAAGAGLVVTVLLRRVSCTPLDRPLAFGPWLALGAVCHLLLI